jgi:hypothetical protein
LVEGADETVGDAAALARRVLWLSGLARLARLSWFTVAISVTVAVPVSVTVTVTVTITFAIIVMVVVTITVALSVSVSVPVPVSRAPRVHGEEGHCLFANGGEVLRSKLMKEGQRLVG